MIRDMIGNAPGLNGAYCNKRKRVKITPANNQAVIHSGVLSLRWIYQKEKFKKPSSNDMVNEAINATIENVIVIDNPYWPIKVC
jgi:hypothetical protein